MRLTLAAPAIALALLTSGCASLKSVQPLASETNTTFDRNLIGVWTDADGEDIIIVREGQSMTYDILWISDGGKESLRLVAKLVELGDSRVLDVMEANPGTFAVPCHVFVNVRNTGDDLQISFLDSKWIQAMIKDQSLAHFEADKSLVITAPTEQLEAFMLKYGTVPEARGDPTILMRR